MRYILLNAQTGRSWHASRGEAMLYVNGDHAIDYNVYRVGGSGRIISLADLLADAKPRAIPKI